MIENNLIRVQINQLIKKEKISKNITKYFSQIYQTDLVLFVLLITDIEKFDIVFVVVELFVMLLGLVAFEFEEEFVSVVFEDVLL